MEIPRHWRLKTQRYRLEGSICPGCGKPMFPPRLVCPNHTDQLARIADSIILVLPATMNTFDIESRIRYESKERMIG